MIRTAALSAAALLALAGHEALAQYTPQPPPPGYAPPAYLAPGYAPPPGYAAPPGYYPPPPPGYYPPAPPAGYAPPAPGYAPYGAPPASYAPPPAPNGGMSSSCNASYFAGGRQNNIVCPLAAAQPVGSPCSCQFEGAGTGPVAQGIVQP